MPYSVARGNGADWLAWRREGIGASEISAVLGLNPFTSRLALYLAKVAPEPNGSNETRPMRWGHRLEADIAEAFAEDTGLHVVGEQAWCFHPQEPWALATVDGFVTESPEATEADAIGVLEIKTTSYDRRAWLEALPEYVMTQVQWQMYVTELPQAWVAVFGPAKGGLDIEVIPVPRDDALIDGLVLAGRQFWHWVVNRTPPTADASRATSLALATAYPLAEQGKTESLDHMVDVLDQLEEARETRLRVQNRIEALTNRLKAVLHDAEVGMVDGQPVVTYRNQERQSVDLPRLTRERPDLRTELEPYVKATGYRVFKPVSTHRKAHP